MGMAAMAGPMLSIGLIGNYMTSGTVLPIYFAYGGLMMVVVMSMLGSAYAIVKIVDAAVKNSVSGSYYYTYHSDNQLGNFMGMWELLNVLVFLTWSMIIMILGMVIGAQMWEKFELLEAAGELTQLEGFKYLLLGFIMAAGIWVASLNVGDMSSSMLGIFDSYNTKIEAINTDGDRDTKGTALFIDVGVHLIETYVTMSVVSSIVIYAVGTLLLLHVQVVPPPATHLMSLDRHQRGRHGIHSPLAWPWASWQRWQEVALFWQQTWKTVRPFSTATAQLAMLVATTASTQRKKSKNQNSKSI